jgi:ABC-2 type transport system ATP-binding protein
MDHADTIASKLSGDMQRCLNLALALVHEPEIVLIDKPSDGLDQQSKLIIWNYIRSLRDLDEKTVILLTQDVNEAESLSDRVAIIDSGQIIKLDTPFNLKKDMGKGDLLEISLSNSNKNQEVIKNLKTIQDIIWVDEVDGYIHLSILNAKSKLPFVMKKIKELNVQVKDFSVHHNTLEDVFIELTGTSLGESK